MEHREQHAGPAAGEAEEAQACGGREAGGDGDQQRAAPAGEVATGATTGGGPSLPPGFLYVLYHDRARQLLPLELEFSSGRRPTSGWSTSTSCRWATAHGRAGSSPRT
ncbi:hypothetical protein AB0H92_27560 [Streptomyces phaeochromogenes]|uniref:hypothetical protein n=1 Tax=Streptomyces phaeochromogenes TaxID=1923 RepID=UPI0033F5C036